jgi:hypothetical protein
MGAQRGTRPERGKSTRSSRDAPIVQQTGAPAEGRSITNIRNDIDGIVSRRAVPKQNAAAIAVQRAEAMTLAARPGVDMAMQSIEGEDEGGAGRRTRADTR